MHVTISLHPDWVGQAGRFAARRAGLEDRMRSVPGLVSYRLLETLEGVAAVAVCRDRAGCDECTRRSAEWIQVHVPDLGSGTPLIVRGEVIAEAVAGAE